MVNTLIDEAIKNTKNCLKECEKARTTFQKQTFGNYGLPSIPEILQISKSILTKLKYALKARGKENLPFDKDYFNDLCQIIDSVGGRFITIVHALNAKDSELQKKSSDPNIKDLFLKMLRSTTANCLNELRAFLAGSLTFTDDYEINLNKIYKCIIPSADLFWDIHLKKK
ncbi:MAG: hypothetical protein MHPSP_004172 [Paramarteilia canceri]